MLTSLKKLCCARAMRRCVVVQEKESWSMVQHEWNQIELKNFFHVSNAYEVSKNPHKLSPMLRRYRSHSIAFPLMKLTAS